MKEVERAGRYRFPIKIQPDIEIEMIIFVLLYVSQPLFREILSAPDILEIDIAFYVDAQHLTKSFIPLCGYMDG